MYRLIMCAIVALFVDNQAVAQTPGIGGNWQVTSVSILWLDTNEATHPYGEHPIGYVQYSPGTHMVVFLSVGDLKPAAGATYTDAERINLYNGIFAAYAGTYRVPEWIGTDQTRYVEVEGNRLVIKTAVLKIPSAAAREYVATVAFERVE
jgi:hypothetical protein